MGFSGATGRRRDTFRQGQECSSQSGVELAQTPGQAFEEQFIIYSTYPLQVACFIISIADHEGRT